MENPRMIDWERMQGQGNEELPAPMSEITLRDLFAGLAMHAFQSNPEDYWGTSDQGLKSAATHAYKQAEAMLIARTTKPEAPSNDAQDELLAACKSFLRWFAKDEQPHPNSILGQLQTQVADAVAKAEAKS